MHNTNFYKKHIIFQNPLSIKNAEIPLTICIYAVLMMTGCTLNHAPTCVSGDQKCEKSDLFDGFVSYFCNDSNEWIPNLSCSMCADDKCVNEDEGRCSDEDESTCIDTEYTGILKKCINNKFISIPCGKNVKCQGNKCEKIDRSCDNNTDTKCVWINETKQSAMIACINNQLHALMCGDGLGCNGNVCNTKETVVKCTNSGETINYANNTCICNKDEHWTEVSGHCDCEPGYVNIDNKCVEEIKCTNIGEIINHANNTCICNEDEHWTDVSDHCDCEPGYINIDNSCVEETRCTNTGETLDRNTNTCICDTDNLWEGEPGNCYCKDGYYNRSGKCEILKPCLDIYNQIKIHDHCTFGLYRQNIDNTDKTALEWEVLAIENDSILLFSYYVLANMSFAGYQFDESTTHITWENSTVRSWLNGLGPDDNIGSYDYSSNNFIDTAFTSDEKKLIKYIENSNPNNPTYGIGGGNNTNDYVFLLSINEINSYYESDRERKAYASKYQSYNMRNMTNTEFINNSDCYNGHCASCYWLRSPGSHKVDAAFIYPTGSLAVWGAGTKNNNPGLRPALWLRKQ